MRKNNLNGLLAAGVVLACGAFPVHAGIQGDLNKFFDQMGDGGANVTQAAAWQGQSAGYLTGGNLFMRMPVRNIQLISVTLPDIKSGCGGIDAYLGSFSFINTDQLKKMGKQILSNAVGYAFDLGLETVCPQCKAIKDNLQNMLTSINNMNISTCQAAQSIVGGLWPKTQEASKKICQDIGGQHDMFSDWAASRQGCGVGDETDKVFGKATPEEKKRIPRSRNLTWSTFEKINQFISDDRELKELIMSMVGTVIYDDKGMVMFVCLFPLMLLMLFVREMTWPIVKSYLGWFASLMMWPLMFSILNFIVNFTSAYMLKGASPTLSNMNQVMSDATTLAGVAGWLTLTVPFLSNYLFTRIGQGVASAGSYVGNALMSATAGDAGSVATGNYNINNQSVDNVNGFKTDLNRVWRSGQTTTQLDNGATETRTADGQHVYQTGEAMSKLPVDINFDHHRASAAQKLTRESEVQTQTALEGYNHSVTETGGKLRQFHDQFGNSDSTTLAAQTGMSTVDAQRMNKAMAVFAPPATRQHLRVGRTVRRWGILMAGLPMRISIGM